MKRTGSRLYGLITTLFMNLDEMIPIDSDDPSARRSGKVIQHVIYVCELLEIVTRTVSSPH